MHACSVGSDSATPWAVDLVAPLFMEFSRQEFWSGLPFSTSGNLPNPGIKPVFPVFLHWLEDSLPLSHQEALRILIGSFLMPLTLQGDLTVSKRHRSRGIFDFCPHCARPCPEHERHTHWTESIPDLRELRDLLRTETS